jgi:NAD(P)H-flavin reductase
MAAPPDPAVSDPMTPLVARVTARRRETADVWTLEIEAEGLQAGEPGQFNMLTAFGVGESAISVSGEGARPGRVAHTIRAVGPTSRALAALRPGAALGVRGPFGAGWPMAAAEGRDVVLVAGGLGLAPLRPALRRLAAQRRRYGRVLLLYGARSPAEIIYRRELERLRARLDLDIEVTVDHAGSDWRGHVGVVTTLLGRASLSPERTLAFVCGPEIMMRFAIAALKDAGLAEADIRLSMERNMRCAIGHCGHCQFGPVFVCRDGPVFGYERVAAFLGRKEL